MDKKQIEQVIKQVNMCEWSYLRCTHN